MSAGTQPPVVDQKERLRDVLRHLSQMSVDRAYSPYSDFSWPERLDDDGYWMSPELLTVYGTPEIDALDPVSLRRLSKWESINFYSLSMYGERDLIDVVLAHIHAPGYDEESEYFHHFIEEENKHMWFFSQFCVRYAGKLYNTKSLKYASFEEPDIKSYLAFAKIMIFEEIGDFYNVRLRDDARLHPFIRHLNAMHHRDEARHLAMGRELLRVMHARLRTKHDQARLEQMELYLKRYMRSSVESFYNPEVYRDAELPDPYGLRARLLRYPAREGFHQAVLKRVMRFFVENHLFSQEGF